MKRWSLLLLVAIGLMAIGTFVALASPGGASDDSPSVLASSREDGDVNDILLNVASNITTDNSDPTTVATDAEEGAQVEDGEFEDGEFEDGELEDGDFEDGELEDGELEDGDFEDGELEDGDFQDGEFED